MKKSAAKKNKTNFATVCLLNKAQVRRYALEHITLHKPQFTRVSKEFVDRTEAMLRAWIQVEMYRHPSKGQTVK